MRLKNLQIRKDTDRGSYEISDLEMEWVYDALQKAFKNK